MLIGPKTSSQALQSPAMLCLLKPRRIAFTAAVPLSLGTTRPLLANRKTGVQHHGQRQRGLIWGRWFSVLPERQHEIMLYTVCVCKLWQTNKWMHIWDYVVLNYLYIIYIGESGIFPSAGMYICNKHGKLSKLHIQSSTWSGCWIVTHRLRKVSGVYQGTGTGWYTHVNYTVVCRRWQK